MNVHEVHCLLCVLIEIALTSCNQVGVPFGLRGTVVAVHHHSAAVEVQFSLWPFALKCALYHLFTPQVVFDEQFVGGYTSQGMCDKFRGRLLPWRHVLKVSVTSPKSKTKQGTKAEAKPETKDLEKVAPAAHREAKKATNASTAAAAESKTHPKLAPLVVPESEEDEVVMILKSPQATQQAKSASKSAPGSPSPPVPVEAAAERVASVHQLFVGFDEALAGVRASAKLP